MKLANNKKDGTITKIISNLCTVETIDGIYDCKPRGKFYHDNISPLVGDYVVIDPENNYILDIKKRKNELSRPTVANIDKAIIVVSVKKPELSLNLLDKMLVNIITKKIEPIICFSKLDLLSFKEKKQLKKIIKYYNSIGIETLTNHNLKKLYRLIKNKIVVLTGQTGAGKSTLINKFDSSFNLATDEISEALGRGKHTTRHVELFKYKDSFIVDTPGFSSLDFDNITKEELKKSFFEFNVKCEFDNCNHINEKNCMVKKLVENNKIMKTRYENYIKFEREI